MSLLMLLLLWKFKCQILSLTCFVSPDYYFIKLLYSFLLYFSKK